MGDPLALATSLAAAAEENYEEGRWAKAVEKFEAASEAYVSATLRTSDTKCVQALRTLALSHAQRAHETRLRIRLQNGLHAADGGGSSFGAGDSSASRAGSAAREAGAEQLHLGGGSTGGGRVSGTTAAASAETLEAHRTFARLSSQLISTHEELRFGAEELGRLLSASGPGGCGSGAPPSATGAISSSALLHSFCVVPSQQRGTAAAASTAAPPPHASQTLQQSVMGAAPPPPPPPPATVTLTGSSEARSATGSLETDGDADLRSSMAQLTAENGRLNRENAALRQRATEVQAVLAKAQRRAADQQRLVRKALSALREVHATTRPDLPVDSAAEIADLRRQLEGAHTARRQQAELVRKYEQRWAQLKASARRKQQAQQQAAAAQQAASVPQPPLKSRASSHISNNAH